MREDDAVRVNCRVRGRPEPQVWWFLRGERVAPGERVKVVVNEAGCHTLLISKAELEDQGVIGCVAANRSGEQRFTCNLRVLPRDRQEAPNFVRKLTGQRTEVGSRVVLQAVATGNPTPNLTWLKVGRE